MTTYAGTAVKYGAVTPNDTTVVGATALYIGVTGDVALKAGPNDTAVTFKSVPVGTLSVSAWIVMSTGTTATNIVALF
jgi:hypothetical protein